MTITFSSPVLRFAPSPTGRLHIGNLRVAILNHLLAEQYGGTFHLRIEDTDTERSEPGFTDKIIEDLKWLGIEYAPEIIYQSENRSLYDNALLKLKEKDIAYPCFCSKEQIEKEKIAAKLRKEPYRYSRTCRSLSEEEAEERMKNEAYVFRFDSQKGSRGKKVISISDKARGELCRETALIEDFILLRSDGNYSFAFTSAVDDIALGTTDIIRGEDHISNSFKQRLIFENLAPEGTYPAYIHLSLLLKPDRTPLSKRHGSLTVDDFSRQGILPEVLYHFTLSPGWSPKGSHFDDSRESYSEELKKHFKAHLNLFKLSRSAAVFDMNRLLWFNAYYIKGLSLQNFRTTLEALKIFKKEELLIPEETPQYEELMRALKESFTSFDEFKALLSPFLENFTPPETKLHGEEKKTLAMLLKELPEPSGEEHLSPEEVKALFKKMKHEHSLSGRSLYHPLRIALTGKEKGLELRTIMQVLPLQRIHARLVLIVS